MKHIRRGARMHAGGTAKRTPNAPRRLARMLAGGRRPFVVAAIAFSIGAMPSGAAREGRDGIEHPTKPSAPALRLGAADHSPGPAQSLDASRNVSAPATGPIDSSAPIAAPDLAFDAPIGAGQFDRMALASLDARPNRDNPDRIAADDRDVLAALAAFSAPGETKFQATTLAALLADFTPDGATFESVAVPPGPSPFAISKTDSGGVLGSSYAGTFDRRFVGNDPPSQGFEPASAIDVGQGASDPVPEPPTLPMIATALAAFGFWRRRMARRA